MEGGSPGKIFVGGLPKETTTEAFLKHFEKYGKVTDYVVMRDRKTGRPRGFGFITYAEPSVVDKVIQDTHVFGGKQVEIKRTIPREAIPGVKDFKTKKIFVGGIPTSVTEDEFRNFFAKFGGIKEHQIMRDHSNNRSRGFGFITFLTEQAVDDLLAQGNRIDFAGVRVEIKKAEPKTASSPPSRPSKHFSNSSPTFGRRNDAYGGYGAEGSRSGSYRSGGPLPSRPGAYGRYAGTDFGDGYGGYSRSNMGPYQGESALGLSGYYGQGTFSRLYNSGNYGIGDSFAGYGGTGVGSYEASYQSGLGPGYGGAGGYGASGSSLYEGRGGYGGGAGGRYHPYSR
uniref:Putative RNA-binding protein C660.15 n=1 Tax=Anthurium amnicola TaxID=1678845 RepID=A0A1D1YXU5_9ARAE